MLQYLFFIVFSLTECKKRCKITYFLSMLQKNYAIKDNFCKNCKIDFANLHISKTNLHISKKSRTFGVDFTD